MYPLERADKVHTKFGEAVQLTLQDSPLTCVKVFLPRRYGVVFSEDDIRSINDKTVSLALI